MVAMTVKILEEIKSGKGIVYAKKDTMAEVISEYHLPVLLLKIGKDTFPAHESKTNYQTLKDGK